jgi:hypothetical protein
MRIEGLRAFRGRNPGGYFVDLPFDIRQHAEMWLHRFCERWRGNLPRWRFAILIGQARRLARTSSEERSAWGRSMLAKRGGKAVQKFYRCGGNGNYRAHRAAIISAARRKWRKEEKLEAELRSRLGLPPKRRIKWLPTEGSCTLVTQPNVLERALAEHLFGREVLL